MKQQTVVIKSNKYGITLFLDRNIPFRELLADIAERFKASSEFFRDARMALAFDGRWLSREEQLEIIRVIQENSSLEILCVLDQDELKESYMKLTGEGMRQGLDATVVEPAGEGQDQAGSDQGQALSESVSSSVCPDQGQDSRESGADDQADR